VYGVGNLSNQVVNAYRFGGGGGAKEATGDGMYCGGATPSYENKASVATNYVWATSTAMASARGYSFGCGYKSAFLVGGGWDGSIVDNSAIWDGSSWATEVTLNTDRRDTTAIAGNSSDCVVATGRDGSDVWITTTAKWNGTAWASAGNIVTTAVEHAGGDGNTSDMLYTAGGLDGGGVTNQTGLYDGTTWSTGVASSFNNSSANVAGANSSAIHQAGGDYASSSIFDGTSWTNSTTYSLSGDTSTRYVTGGGVFDSHWIQTGLAGSSGNSTCGNWNGTAWESKGAMTVAVYAGAGDGSV